MSIQQMILIRIINKISQKMLNRIIGLIFFTYNIFIKGLLKLDFDPEFKRFAYKLTKNLYWLNICQD